MGDKNTTKSTIVSFFDKYSGSYKKSVRDKIRIVTNVS